MFHSLGILIFQIPRVAFEEKPYLYVVWFEIYLNIVFFIEMVKIFLTPLTLMNGKKEFSKYQIAVSYIKSWFFYDLFAFYPLAYLRYISVHSEGSFNDWSNFINQNYERLPRFYKIMLLLQLSRARYAESYFKKLLKALGIRMQYQTLVMTFLRLIFLLHCTGCFWYAASIADIKSNKNWVTENKIENEGLFFKYVCCLYWATVTISTVGYGDITPTNGYEVIWALFIIAFGVAVFAFILSELSSNFLEILNSNSSKQDHL